MGTDGSVGYPPPFTEDGGPGDASGGTYPYPLEFVNVVGPSCLAEQTRWPTAVCFEEHSGTPGNPGSASDYPDYLDAGHGSPHYCSQDGKDQDVSNDWCPYIFFGPSRGKYRHPHIAYAALEVFLANQTVAECGPTWDDGDGANFPSSPDNSAAFPMMELVDGNPDDPEQPEVNECGFIWPGAEGDKKKAVPGVFNIEMYLTPTSTSRTRKLGHCNKSGKAQKLRPI